MRAKQGGVVKGNKEGETEEHMAETNKDHVHKNNETLNIDSTI